MKKLRQSYINARVFFMLMVLGLSLSACAAQSSSGSGSPDMAMADADMEEAGVEEAKSAEPPVPGGLTTDYKAAPALPKDRKLIRTVEIQAETTEFDKLLTQITSKIAQLGGYTEESRIDGESLYNRSNPAERMAVMTIRVPGDKLEQLIFEVEGNSNIIAKVESAKDITLQYADVESRKKSLEIEQERVWALLEKAEDIESILSLESHLTEIRYQLENMGSQLRLYDNQVSYSTVQLTIQEVINLTEQPLPTDTNANRIISGFKNSMKNVSTGLTNLCIILITSLPYIAVVAVVGLIVFLVYRRGQRNSAEDKGEKKKRSFFKKS